MTTRSTNNIAQNIYAFCRGVDWIKVGSRLRGDTF